MSLPPVAVATYSVKPRGGVVHTLHLAEALHAAGYPVHVVALGDPAEGFFRPVRAPFTIVPAPPHLPTLEERVFASVDALAGGLSGLADGYPLLHAQDCISARAACRVRDCSTGAAPLVIRTVHHVDDFTTQALIDCQRQAISEPDRILVVSDQWRRILEADYAVSATVVRNGVDLCRFQSPDRRLAGALRERAGPAGQPLILTVGGIEPRKGSETLVRAIALLRDGGLDPVLAVVGGHSFQDYRAYRERVFSLLPELGLKAGRDIVLLGTVADAELPSWYAAADVFAFPSAKEGWGLAVLEAMSAGLPVVASDLPVFREYLTPGRDALLVPVDSPAALAGALASVLGDPQLAARLRAAGRTVAARFTWEATAAEHKTIYAAMTRSAGLASELRWPASGLRDGRLSVARGGCPGAWRAKAAWRDAGGRVGSQQSGVSRALPPLPAGGAGAASAAADATHPPGPGTTPAAPATLCGRGPGQPARDRQPGGSHGLVAGPALPVGSGPTGPGRAAGSTGTPGGQPRRAAIRQPAHGRGCRPRRALPGRHTVRCRPPSHTTQWASGSGYREPGAR